MTLESSTRGRLLRVFFPYAADRRDAVAQQRLRLVYYTTAETATRIIGAAEIWMRNTTVMNDYSEVEHGIECLNLALKSRSGAALKSAVDECHPGLAGEALQRFDEWLLNIRTDSFITCLSEHPANEDLHGRLSMWRAYGGSAGVALVINPAALSIDTPNLGVVASPVAYWSQEQVELQMQRVAAGIGQESELVQAATREEIKNELLSVFRAAVLSTKHPAFAEEREWRIIATPSMYRSPLLTECIESIGGVPQPVQKLALKNIPDRAIVGLEIPELVERVIIGPCSLPAMIYRALFTKLEAAGVKEAGTRIHVSNIPLRGGA